MGKWLQSVFGRPEPVVTDVDDEPSVRDNVFSSGGYTDKPSKRLALMRRTQAAMAMTFQRGVESLVPQDEAGNRITTTDVAMDEAYPDLTSAKLANTRGGWLPVPQLEWYAGQGFIGWQMCAILSQNWLIDKACGVPAADAVRNGYDILQDDGEELRPDVLNAIKKADKRINIKGKCRQFIKKGRIFGIRHALFLIDGVDYSAPFNPDGIRPGSYRGIVQIDPYWLAPVLDQSAAANPSSTDFYEPTWWQVNNIRIHKSHFIITRCGDDVADILKPSYYYGGIPIPQKLYNRVYAAERVADEAPMLAMTKRLMTLKTDITNWFGPNAKAQSQMQEWMELQNNFSVKVVGSKDEVQQFDTSLQGLDETIMTQYQLVAAAANMPATKLLGTTPKGFNSTGEYDEASYHEELESIQEDAATPFIERHHLCLMRSVIAPKFGLNQKTGTEINWRPTDSMTAKEEAEVNEIKSRTATNYVAAGAIDGLDVRRNIIGDPESGFTGIEEVVPDGPGDREAEAEMKQAMLEGPDGGGDKDSAQDEATAAGILFRAGDKILLMKNRDSEHGHGWWALPAGKVEAGETSLQAACREFREETGKTILRAGFVWGDDAFAIFATYGDEFVPTLCTEHSAYGWFSPAELPTPLHPRLAEQLEIITGETGAAGIAPVGKPRPDVGRDVALDDHWITVKPNGEEHKGTPVLLGEGGEIKAGMGGKFDGKNIKNLKGGDEGGSSSSKTENKSEGKTETSEGSGPGEGSKPAAPETDAQRRSRQLSQEADELTANAKTADDHNRARYAHLNAAFAARAAGDMEGHQRHTEAMHKHSDEAIATQKAEKKAAAATKREMTKKARSEWTGKDFSSSTPEEISETMKKDVGITFVNGTHAEAEAKAAWKDYQQTRSDESLETYRKAKERMYSHPGARVRGHNSVDIDSGKASAKQMREVASQVHDALEQLKASGYDLHKALEGSNVSFIAGSTGKANGHAWVDNGVGYFAISPTKRGLAFDADQQRYAAAREQMGKPRWSVSTTAGIDAKEAARSTIVHEFAHALGLQPNVRSPEKLTKILQEKFGTDRAAMSAWIKSNISEYATSNIKETDAELAAMVTSPHYVRGTLPPEFEKHVDDLFKKKGD